jgi:hypothetical protein
VNVPCDQAGAAYLRESATTRLLSVNRRNAIDALAHAAEAFYRIVDR